LKSGIIKQCCTALTTTSKKLRTDVETRDDETRGQDPNLNAIL